MKFRLDFRFVNVSDDPDNPQIASVLDPDRYEPVLKNGAIEGVIDKLDPRHLFFPAAVIEESIASAMEMELHDDRSGIVDSDAYIRSRAAAIAEGVHSGVTDGDYRNINNEELQPTPERHFVIVSIDLVGSTKLSQAISPLQFAHVIQTYAREVTLMCAEFRGRVLKPMGDGMLLYFSTATIARRHDFAIDCAMSLRDLVLDGINQALKSEGMPALACRIGLDSGTAPVVTIGSSQMYNAVDVVGEVVNIAAKIEKSAPTNSICAGASIAMNTHTMWLKHFVPYDAPQGWPYTDRETGKPYQVYLLNLPSRTVK